MGSWVRLASCGSPAGNLFTSSLAESLLAGSLFEGHILNVARKLTSGRKCVITTMPLRPTLIRRGATECTFGEVFHYFLDRFHVLAIGILRNGAVKHDNALTSPLASPCTDDSDAKPVSPVVSTTPSPLRRTAPVRFDDVLLRVDNDVLQYVYTAPDHDAIVSYDDLVYLLVNHQNRTMYSVLQLQVVDGVAHNRAR